MQGRCNYHPAFPCVHDAPGLRFNFGWCISLATARAVTTMIGSKSRWLHKIAPPILERMSSDNVASRE
jgi:hypothetical protein